MPERLKPSTEDPFGGKKLNITGIDPILNFVENNRGYIAGATLCALTFIPTQIARANGIFEGDIPNKIQIGLNIIGAATGGAVGAIKELLDVEEKGENSTVQLIGNTVLGIGAGWSITDLAQTVPILAKDGQISIKGIPGLIKLSEPLFATLGPYFMWKTTGPIREHVGSKIQENRELKQANREAQNNKIKETQNEAIRKIMTKYRGSSNWGRIISELQGIGLNRKAIEHHLKEHGADDRTIHKYL